MESHWLRFVLYCGAICLLVNGCSSESDGDENQQTASCLLDSTSNESCWSFTNKTAELLATIKTKCEDGSGFGSKGIFSRSSCDTSRSIGSCYVVFEDLGAGTLYFLPDWGEQESAEVCVDILSGSYSDAGGMAIVRAWQGVSSNI